MDDFDRDDVQAARKIIARYGDQAIGLADASIVVLARRYSTRRVATLDQRHFTVLPPADRGSVLDLAVTGWTTDWQNGAGPSEHSAGHGRGIVGPWNAVAALHSSPWQACKMPDRLMLLDAASLYFRAYFGVPDSLKAPDGTSVNAVRGLLDFMARLITDRRPTHLVACWDDDWRPAFRVEAVPSYKAHRLAPDGTEEIVPAGLVPQIAIIEEVLGALGIARVGSPGHEADDVIGTICAAAKLPVDVVTGDRDLFQVVDDARKIRVLYTARGVGRHEIVDEAAVIAKYGIPGRAYADFALLRGDPSDGLPGVPGIGEKTAAQLITKYGSLDGLLAALEARDPGLSRGVRAKLEAAGPYLAVAPAVVAVARDAPLPGYDDRLPDQVRDAALLVKLVERWDLESPVNRLLTALRVRIA